MGRCAIFFGRIQMVRCSVDYIPVLTYLAVDISGWGLSPRGAGFLFGADITKQFARDNAIDLIARAHQLAMEGFKLMFDRTIVTVWSAPNYCYRWVAALAFVAIVIPNIPPQLWECCLDPGTGRAFSPGV